MLNIQMRMYLNDIKEDILERWEKDPEDVTEFKEDIPDSLEGTICMVSLGDVSERKGSGG